jgi:hypothetical protein
MGETFDRINKAFKDTADKTADSAGKVADTQTYTNPNNANENRDYERRGKEPVNPEAISEHEPTALKRDKNAGVAGDPVYSHHF